MVSNPDPTKGITKEVVTELLWTMAVVINPREKLDKSLLKRYRSRSIWSLSNVRNRIEETMYFNAMKRMTNAIHMPNFGPVTERIEEVTGFIMIFKGLTKVNPPMSLNLSAITEADFSMKWNFISRGKRIMTADRLKKSWTVAPAKAFLNSSLRVMCPKETNMLVTVVPMFAPMTMGMALVMVRLPPPTRATTTEVVADELWTMDVERMPTTNPT